MVKVLVGVSHLDHGIDAETITALLAGEVTSRVGKPGDAFFICEVRVNEPVPCALRGPIVGDLPIQDSNDTGDGLRIDVFHAKRGNRPNESRMVRLPTTLSNTVTIIGGLSKEHPNEGCIVFTAYGGPLAPQEPGDPFLSEDNREASERFWSEHALSAAHFGL